MTTVANQNSAPTILAGLSVAISVASLLLSYRTWRRQCDWEDANKNNASTLLLTKPLTEEAKPLTKKPLPTLPAEDKPTAEEITNTTDKDSNNPNRIRATLENQILSHNKNNGLTVQPIGVIRSIYKLCVGTPRQGLLAPHARGRIELTLETNHAMDCVQELENFSHIWILFIFHLNTLSSKNQNNVSPKIAPPALGGMKVGVLATRSPHRINPIGMTLAKLDRVEIKDRALFKRQQKEQQQEQEQNGVSTPVSRVVLHISGLDLVDGTPVLDVKPFVPVYDSVTSPPPTSPWNGNETTPPINNNAGVKLPPWVSEGLATRRSVTISDEARTNLETILEICTRTSNGTKSTVLDFYGSNYGESPLQAMENMLACITEVLSMDVRSSWQTQKARKGDFQAERSHRLNSKSTNKSKQQQSTSTAASLSDNPLVVENNDDKVVSGTTTNTCTQQLDNLLLHYTVTEASELRSSEGSGAEDQVCVTSIEQLQ